MPTSDKHVSYIVKNRKKLNGSFNLLMPENDILKKMLVKAEEFKLIKSMGIELPKTITNIPADYRSILEELALPVILKPKIHSEHLISSKNLILRSEEQLKGFIKENQEILFSLIAQEIIPGNEEDLWISSCTVDKNHDLVSSFVFNKLSTSPSKYGVTSYAISRNNETVRKLSAELCKKISYVGLIDIEFKFDRRDNTYKYIEINPRVGMCAYFDTCAGINNVANAFYVATNNADKIEAIKQKNGVMFHCLYDDLYSRLKNGEGILEVIKLYIHQYKRPYIWLYFKWNDPMPSLIRLFQNLKEFSLFIKKRTLP